MTFSLPEPTRHDKLRGWLLTHRLTYAHLAAAAGINRPSICMMLKSETARPERVEKLIALGIPAELLPEPKYIKPGPKAGPKPHNSTL